MLLTLKWYGANDKGCEVVSTGASVPKSATIGALPGNAWRCKPLASAAQCRDKPSPHLRPEVIDDRDDATKPE